MSLKDPEMETSEEELFEDDVLEVVELSDNEVLVSDPDEVSMSDAEDEASAEPTRDDSLFAFSKHEGSVFSIDVQPVSGELAVTGGQDDMAYVWDVNAGNVVLACTGHKDSVTSVGFNHDGTYVATGDLSGCIQVWELSTKTQIWKTEIGDISWLRWHPAENVLLAAAKTGEVYVWVIPSGQCDVLPSRGVRSECGHVLQDGRRLAIGYDDGSLNLFELRHSKLLHRLPPYGGLPEGIISMDGYGDSSLVVYGTEGTLAHLMKTRTGQIVSTYKCADTDTHPGNDGVEAIGFCKEKPTPWAATGTLSGKLTLWDISREAKRSEHQQAKGIIKLLWVKQDLLITGGMDGILRLYDGRSGNVEREFHGHSKNIFDFAVSMKKRRILSASDDKTVRIFNTKRPKGQKKAN